MTTTFVIGGLVVAGLALLARSSKQELEHIEKMNQIEKDLEHEKDKIYFNLMG